MKQTQRPPLPPCPECGRQAGFDKCAHVECPKRRQRLQDPYWTHERLPGGGYLAKPRLKE